MPVLLVFLETPPEIRNQKSEIGPEALPTTHPNRRGSQLRFWNGPPPHKERGSQGSKWISDFRFLISDFRERLQMDQNRPQG